MTEATWRIYMCNTPLCDNHGNRWPVRVNEENVQKRCPECNRVGIFIGDDRPTSVGGKQT